ncbi:Protein TIFY 10B [Acorus calamus]|uniref:Protein TIFY n=1 Tax=Acorus calamus TaxID=4465 RepID=A0AAV9E8M4_ACOCL|nr:Protein TIFY 10B [Acorus calamus]
MSNSSDLKGRTSERAPEKSNFSVTCSLLSQYLKEKGSFGDLSLGMKGNVEMPRPPVTVNLLSGLETSAAAAAAAKKVGDGCCGDSPAMGLFPLTETRKPDSMPESGQMTIFYGGRVIVFNNFSADKAKEIMALASKATTFTTTTTTNSSTHNLNNNNNPPQASMAPDATQNNLRTVASDQPIKRKASLQRFMEKRKDRVSSKKPYETSTPSLSPLTKLEENKPWFGPTSQGL